MAKPLAGLRDGELSEELLERFLAVLEAHPELLPTALFVQATRTHAKKLIADKGLTLPQAIVFASSVLASALASKSSPAASS